MADPHSHNVITANVESQRRTDHAVRIIGITGGPVIDLDPAYYHRDTRYRVTHLELHWDRGSLTRAEISGPVLRKNGSDGLRQRDQRWFISPRTGDWSTKPPAWVMHLIGQYGTVPTWEETDPR